MDTTIISRRRDAALLLVLVVIAAYLRPMPAVSLMGRDETSYAFLIKHMLDGTFMNDPIFFTFHPLFPLLTAVVARLGINVELAGRAVSYTLSIATVIPVYIVGRLCFSRTAGFVAGLCCALSPSLIGTAGTVMSEATYCFFLFLSACFLVLLLKEKKAFYAVAVGASFAMAYLTRAEGYIIFILVVIFVLAAGKKLYGFTVRKLAMTAALMVVVFMVTASPYVLAIKSRQGELKMTNKTSSVLKQTAFLAVFGTYENMASVQTRDIDLFWIVLAEYPSSVKKFVDLVPQSFGVLPFALFFLGIFLSRRLGIDGKILLCFLPFIAVIPAIIFFEYAPRHIIPYAPFFYVVSSGFIARLDLMIKSKIPRHIPVVIILFIVVTFGGRFLPSKTDGASNQSAAAYSAYQQFGLEISRKIEPGAAVMARYNMVAWYAGGDYQGIPGTVSDLNKYGENGKLRYIVLGPAEQQMRPEITSYVMTNPNFKQIYKNIYNNFMEFYLVEYAGSTPAGR